MNDDNEPIKVPKEIAVVFLSGISDRYGEKGTYIVLRKGITASDAISVLRGATVVVSGCVTKTEILCGYVDQDSIAIRAIAKENKKPSTTEEEE